MMTFNWIKRDQFQAELINSSEINQFKIHYKHYWSIYIELYTYLNNFFELRIAFDALDRIKLQIK